METSDLTPDLWMVAPDAAYVVMLASMLGPPFRRRHHCSEKCYRGNGFDVHVKPYCHKRVNRGYL